MAIIEESRLQFEFSDECNVVKFDDTTFYRKYFNALPEAKGVDFISEDRNTVAFIEVKNCKGDEGNCRWRIFPNNLKKITTHTTLNVENRDSLDIEVPQKVAMTLAALTGARSFGTSKAILDELRVFIDAVFSKDFMNSKKKMYVILFLEGDFGSHTRSKKMIMSELQRSMNQKMKWMNCKVSVVDSDTYDPKIFRIVS